MSIPSLVNQEIKTTVQTVKDSIVRNSNIFITPDTVQQIISKLPKKKMPGIDLITNTTLRFLPKNMILSLTKIFSGCLKISYFAEAWKLAQIFLISKPGKNYKFPEGYR